MATRSGLLTCLDESALGTLKTWLKHEGYAILEIDGTAVHDSQTLFLQIREKLPLDPPLSGAVNWDALSDSLWEGVSVLSEPHVALIWTEVQNIVRGGLPDFLVAVDTLSTVARSVYDTSSGITSPKEMVLFLVGRGLGFPALLAD